MGSAREYLERMLQPVTDALSLAVAERLVQLQVDASLQDRIDVLAGKCTEGELTADERTEYESYVSAANVIAILQAKARAFLAAAGRNRTT